MSLDEHMFNYLDISLGMQYYFSSGTSKIYIHSSVEYNHLIRYHQIGSQKDYSPYYLTPNDNTNLKIERNINPKNISINMGLGIEFNITNKAHFFSHLNYRNMLEIVTPDSMTQDRLHSYGLKLGLRMEL